MAVGIHIAAICGGMKPGAPLSRGGLAPWQRKRAEDTLALTCGFTSESHLRRAFKRIAGTDPTG